ncbi:MAG: chromate transporter [Deltaproteobacteria bacterium]|nr:chromate transporter [Deltaproteobacteria bacterium]
MRLPQLSWHFIKIGSAAFGGLGVTLSLIERYLVKDQGVLTARDVTESLTYTKFLPGSTGVQVVGYLGYRLGGWPGALLATGAFLFPAFLFMLVLSILYVATIYRLAKPAITTLTGGLVAVTACALGIVLRVNPALIVLAAGFLGIMMPQRFTQGQSAGTKESNPDSHGNKR